MYESVSKFFNHCTNPNGFSGDGGGLHTLPASSLSRLPLDLSNSFVEHRSGGHSSDSFRANDQFPRGPSSFEIEPPNLFTDWENIDWANNQAITLPPNTVEFGTTGQPSFSWYDNLTGQTQAWSLNPTTAIANTAGPTNLAIAPNFFTSELTPPSFQIVAGTLNADVFTYDPANQYALYSGNGNASFGLGGRDVLDLSNISSATVSATFATATGGGVLFNPGNGTRVFDAISFSNGNQVLFEGLDSIQFADGVLNLSTVPNDPGFNQQWNLHMMGVQDAWRFTTGSNAVAIGIEDTGLGVDSYGYIHPDLRSANTYIYGNNYQDDFFRTFPGQGYGTKTSSHGTDVQGIIAAASNNGLGMSGINWNSDVINIDVLDGNVGDQSLAEAAQNMINIATSHGQRLVINMSLGGGGIDPDFEQLVATNRSNALFVIASGNDNASSLSNPASLATKYDNVIAVGASWGNTDSYGIPTSPGTRISYPGWWGSNYGNGLTLMGPSEVMATSATQTASGVSFGYDTQFNGTSAATPNVTGVASLVWSVDPTLTANQVQTILSTTAYDLGASGRDRVYGNGFINADAAVRRALALAEGAN